MPTRIASGTAENVQTDLPATDDTSSPARARPAPYPTQKNGVSTFDASELQQLLSTDASSLDFFVTHQEATTALNKLEQLAPADFYKAMQSLGEGGQLATMLDKLEWEDQCRFLRVASEKGSVEARPEEKAKGPLNPPGQPKLYVMNRELPRCVNDLIHEHSKAQYGQFVRDYREYSARYEDAVSQCKSLREIQQLGRPASAYVAREYTAVGDRRSDAYDRDFSRLNNASELKPYLAVANRMSDLTGEVRDGAAWFEFKLETKSQDGVVHERNGRAGPNEPRTMTDAVGVELEYGEGEAKYKELSDGSTEATAAIPLGEVSLTMKRGAFDEAALELGPVKLTQETGGTALVELTALRLKDDGLELGSWAAGGVITREIRGGVRGKLEAGDVEVEGRIGVGVRGLREETVRRALSSSNDVFAPPKELEAHTAWQALPHQRRDELTKFGWTETDWKTALAGGAS